MQREERVMRRFRILGVSLVAVALMASACGDDKDKSTVSGAGGQSGGGSTTSVASFPAGSTMANLQAKGKITIGVKYDQPGFGQRNPTTNEIEGFDVEIGKIVAAAIFGGKASDVGNKVTFTESVSANREPYLQNGTVDMVIATYTINDTRKQVVDFAGPYFIAHQDIMVKSSDNTI